MAALYDRIGIDYANLRRPDPRIARLIHAQLNGAETVLNVGAGTGSYEPEHLDVTAVEPSAEMIRQRPAEAARVVRAPAEALPFDDNAFDAAMAVLTIHHWNDQTRGLREVRRVTKGTVAFLTYDSSASNFWLLDYLPELAQLDRRQMPTLDAFEAELGPVKRIPVPIPRDCTDGFLCAYWQRPAAYLDPKVRQSISSFWKIGEIEPGLQRLRADLHNGDWERRYGHILELEDYDFGYHLVVTST